MSSSTSQSTTSATDWRKQIQTNDRRTFLVIATFMLIYAAVGLIIDLYIHPFPPEMPIEQDLIALLTFQVTPIATLIISSIAAISILISYSLYDKIVMLGTDYKEINPKTSSSLEERQLYNVVEELKLAAGLRFMPKVFIIEAPYMNAFASGYSEKSALIAITRGLMEKLNRAELQAVMAHELSHIRHHDIKLTMAASLMTNILIIALDIMFRGIIFSGAGRNRNNREENNGSGNALAIVIIILRFVLPILTMLLMLFLSRTREYMADAGAVELMRDNTPLGKALLKIQDDHENHQEAYAALYQNTAHENVRQAAYIFDPVEAGFNASQAISTLFSTHPSVKNRLKALGFQ